MAIINRKIPHATIPPTIGRLVTMLEAFPYVATPIKMKPTMIYTMFNATSAFLEKLKPPHILCILIFYPKEGIAS